MLSPQLTKGIIDDCIGGGRTELLPRLLTGILNCPKKGAPPGRPSRFIPYSATSTKICALLWMIFTTS